MSEVTKKREKWQVMKPDAAPRGDSSYDVNINAYKWQNWRTLPVVAVKAGLWNSVLVLARLLSEVGRQPRVITLAGEIFHHGLTQLGELNDGRSTLQRTEKVIKFILHSRKLFNVYTWCPKKCHLVEKRP